MESALWLGLFAPLAGFLILLLTSFIISRRLANFVGCVTIFIAFCSFSYLLWIYNTTNLGPTSITLFHWLPVDRINADFVLHVDPLSLVMTMIITGVGFLIHVYSIGYMDHEEDYARYFACMNLFVFSMLLLVLAGHLLLLFVGWEGVGLASYLLIGYYYFRPAAASAATKAFVVNRIGDLGLLLGLLLTFHLFGTGDIATINQQVSQQFQAGATIITILTLLYFVGATGKSAQIPLQTWLPDAMEGPTPVSALIHAATMVTAGVYLVVRMHPVFMLSPTTLYVIGIIGGVTSLYAALCAVGQTDLKRVLAYSTVSQLGLMFLACGVGGFYTAMFHLTNHAFIKALLFLSAGNVIHMMRGVTDMEKMGGLAKIFTKTHWLFLIGVLALAGIPPFAAFFSKDLILDEEYETGHHILYLIGLAASILTGFYLMRAYCLTFLNTPKLAEKILKTIHEAPKVMLAPVTILALFSIGGGFLGYSYMNESVLESFLAEADVKMPFGIENKITLSIETTVAIVGAFAGVIISWILYTHYPDRPISLFKHAFYIDEIYDALIVKPAKGIACMVARLFEPYLFDGVLRVLVKTTQHTAGFLQRMQSGEVRSYVAWMALGAVVLIAYLLI